MKPDDRYARFAALVPDVADLPAPGTELAGLGPADADWLAADASGDFGRGAADAKPCVPRFAMLVHRSRPDLQQAFPEPLGRSRAAFSYWYVTCGRLEYALPSRLVGPALASLGLRRRLAALARWWWTKRARPPVASHPRQPRPATALERVHDTWEKLAQADPLWAILTREDKRQGRWDPQEFFATGREEIAETLERLDELGIDVDRAAALDFGCGAGRLTQALARHFDRAVGVDVSETMVRLARQHSRDKNTSFVLNQRDDLGALSDGTFSFLYTARVLQHIRPELMERYVRDFFRVLAPGGVAVFQIPSGLVGGDPAASALPAGAYRARLEVSDPPRRLPAGGSVRLGVRVTNAGSVGWPAGEELGAFPIRLANQWLTARGRMLIRDQSRVGVWAALDPGRSQDLEIMVTAPPEPGEYVCRLDLVHEQVTWFSSRGSAPVDLPLEVTAAAEGKSGRPLNQDDAAETAIEMHVVAPEEVTRWVEESGGAVLNVSPDGLAGPAWTSLTYHAVKLRSAAGATAGSAPPRPG